MPASGFRPAYRHPAFRKRTRVLSAPALSAPWYGSFEVLEARALLSIDTSLDGSGLQTAAAAPSATPSLMSSTIGLTTPFDTDSTNATVRNPQSKVWQRGSNWFAILDGPALGTDPAGTYVWKLVGSTWVQGPIVINKQYLADVKPVGNADTIYAALYGSSKIQVVKLEFRASFGGNNNYNNYVLTSTASVTLSTAGAGTTDTATIDIDSRGHMWVAYDTANTVEVRYSLAAPYTTWSDPFVLANTSSSDRDISAVVAFGNKIGVMWSNHSTEEWGFRYHNDADDGNMNQLTTWSSDERPGATTDPTHNHNVGNGMADDHLNIKASSNGTLYAAIKTAYDAGTKANVEQGLLIRSPGGTWSPVYGIDGNGTRQIIELNETDGFLRYIYGGETGINDIVYKDIPLAAIDPSQPDRFYSGNDVATPGYPRQTLIGGGNNKMVSGTKQPFQGTLALVATRASGTPYTTSEGVAPFAIVGAVITDTGTPTLNLPPVNTVPATQTTLEDTARAFSVANGNRIAIADPDAGAANVRVTLTITGGTAAIGAAGLSVTGNGTTSIVATGSITNLNAGLGSLVFTPTSNSNTTGSITILTDDLGNAGLGGSQTDSDTVTINITAVNDAPSFVKGADQTVLEDSGQNTVANWATAASAGPANESAQTLSYSTTNDNNALFSVQPAVAANGTLTYTPAANAFGSATVSVTLSDSGGTANGGVNSVLQTFVITVSSVNDAPSYVTGADQTVLEDSGVKSVANWATAITAGPASESAQTLNFIVTNNNNALFAVQPAIAANGTLTFTPADNASGSATISVSLRDNGSTASGGVDTSAIQTFVINVTPVNDAPSFVQGANQTVLEDSGGKTVTNWATAISAGPASETAQALNFVVTNNNNALFAVQPTIAPNGTLTFTPADNANGSATVSVSLHDDGGTANGGVDTSAIQTFVINVTPVNDVPSFVKGGDIPTPEDSELRTIANWATAISAGPANEAGQALNFIISNNNPALFAVQPAIAANGTLTFTPATNAVGTATVSVSLHDNGGTANGGADTSPIQTFVISVTPVNDAPSFVKGADQRVLEDSGAKSVSNWATAISAGPANEAGQALNFVVSNSNPTLFAVQPAIALNGTLTFTPANNARGSATVSVSLHDNGGTVDGGSDNSPVQMFVIAVTPVNDAPAFTAGEDQVIAEDSSLHTIANWATAISAGPPDEAGQLLNFVVTNNNNALFSVQPAVAAGGTLTYTLAANATGAAAVNVSLHDNGGTADGGVDTSAIQTLIINVTNVNDAPILANSGTLALDAIATTPAENPGTLVAALIASVPGLITDNDVDALEGIAITAADTTHGQWEFSTSGGGVWTPLGSLAAASRLLAADANTRVRFLPSAGFTGTIASAITFRAWDRTNGNNGDLVNTDTSGGATAFSTAQRTASINVAPSGSMFAVSLGQNSVHGNDEGRSVAIDTSGNTLVGGSYYFSDGASDTPGGGTGDIYIAKLSPTGAVLWQQTIGSPSGDDRATAITTDAAGNVYVTGQFQGTVDFDAGAGVSNLNVGNSPAAIFVLKLDAAGAFQWVRGYGSATGISTGYGVAVDTAGNPVVTGQFSGAINFNASSPGTNLTSAGAADIFVLKLDSAGAYQWVKGIGGAGHDRGAAVTTDSTNRVYVTGSFTGTVDFDPGAAVSNLVSAGGSDAFVLRLAADGSFSFADGLGGLATDEGLDIALDAAGNILTTGSFQNAGDFSPAPGSGGPAATLGSGGGFDVFVSKFSPTNQFLWAKSFGNSGDDRARGIAALSDGSVALVGSFSGTVDFDPGSGVASLAAAGASDVFLSCLSTDGDFLGARSYGGATSDLGRGIVAVANNAVHLTGRYASAAAFDTGAGIVNLQPLGGDDVFVAKVLPPDGIHSPSATDPSLPLGPGTLDVNGDALVSALDVLLIVNLLNARQSPLANVTVDQFNAALDVNLDQLITPLDALVVVNSLNSRSLAAAQSSLQPSSLAADVPVAGAAAISAGLQFAAASAPPASLPTTASSADVPTVSTPTAPPADAAFADPAIDWTWLSQSTNDDQPAAESDLFDLLASSALPGNN